MRRTLGGKARLTRLFSTFFVVCILLSLCSVAFAVDVTIPTADNAAVANVFEKTYEARTGSKPTTTSGVITEYELTALPSSSVPADDAGTVPAQTVLKVDSAGKKVTFSLEAYKNSDSKDVKALMQEFINNLKASSVSSNTQQDIMTRIQDSDTSVASMMLPMIFENTSADLYTAYRWVYPLLNSLRVVLGVGTIALIAMIMLSTVFDLAYIGLPMLQAGGEEGKKKPFGVSFEALTTVKDVQSQVAGSNGNGYKNAYFVYFRRRAVTYIILSVCIVYLIAGELSGLIGWLLSLVGGVVG